MSPTALADLLDTYLDELVEAGIPDPLRQRFTLGAVLDDLSRLAGDAAEPLPAFVADERVAWHGEQPPS